MFWLIKTFFCGIATILPLFILTSELIAISTSFRYFYTCLDPRPCHFLLAHVSSNEVSMRGAVPPTGIVAANSSKSFVRESGQPSGSQLLFPGSESGCLGLRIVNSPKISRIQCLAFRPWGACRSWTDAGEVSKSSFPGRFR